MPEQRRFFSFLFLLCLLAISLIFHFFCSGVYLLRKENESILSYVQSSFLSIKGTIPINSKINQISQCTPKMSRKNQNYLKILRPGAHSKQFAQRATEFFDGSRPDSLNSTNANCNLSFFMTWISPLEYFGPRELFAIESLFKSHPNACLLIVSTTMDSSQGIRLLRPFLANGFRVAAFSPDYEYLISGTPAEIWLNRLRKGEVDPGKVSFGQNLSNLLRLLILYKYGGIYVDTDVIVIKSFYGLKNSIGAQTVDAARQWSRLNNAVMVFDKKHPLMLEFIREFASTFDGNKWGHNGPYLVSRVVSRVVSKSSYNVSVLPPIAFYPVDWSRIGGLFQGPTSRVHSKWMREKLFLIQKASFAVHLWNRESRGMKVEKESIIARILLDCCIFCNSSVIALLN